MTNLNWITEIKRRGAPLGMHYLCYGMNKYVPYLFGVPFLYDHVVYLDSSLRKVKEEDEILKASIRHAFATDHSYFINVGKKIRADALLLTAFTRDFANESTIRDTPVRDLGRLFEGYISMMSHFGTYFRFMEPATSTLETLMFSMLREKLPNEAKATEALLLLSVSPEPDYVKSERRSLLAVAALADQALSRSKRLELSQQQYVQLLMGDVTLRSALIAHAAMYSWMGTADHLGSPYPPEQYAAHIHGLAVDDPEAELAGLRKLDGEQQLAAGGLLEELDLNPHQMMLVKSAQEFDYLNAFVKEMVLSNQCRIEPLLTRISRTLEIDRVTTIHLTFEEILLALRANEPLNQAMRDETRQRQDDWGMSIYGPEIKLYSGESLARFKEQFVEPDFRHLAVVQGITACPGIIRGRARVLNSVEEFGKIGFGDVVITAMTTPEYSAVIDRLGGIVTDEGGVTSHAGSIARERQIPCVVGTRIATKVFTDDDFIELDANSGIVKKVPEEAVDLRKHAPAKETGPIMVIDDQVEEQSGIRDALIRAGISPASIKTYSDDRQALKAFDQLVQDNTPPSVMVVDCWMRGEYLAGVGLVEALVETYKYRADRIFVYSGITWEKSDIPERLRAQGIERLNKAGVVENKNLLSKQQTPRPDLAKLVKAVYEQPWT